MKAYTDLEQSKKLAEILPIESADMDYIPICNLEGEYSINVNIWNNDHLIDEGWIPCWSLAALFNILSDVKLCHYNDKYFCQYIGFVDDFPKYSTFEYDNPVDACYEMIIHLHELNLL